MDTIAREYRTFLGVAALLSGVIAGAVATGVYHDFKRVRFNIQHRRERARRHTVWDCWGAFDMAGYWKSLRSGWRSLVAVLFFVGASVASLFQVPFGLLTLSSDGVTRDAATLQFNYICIVVTCVVTVGHIVIKANADKARYTRVPNEEAEEPSREPSSTATRPQDEEVAV